jgi:hypothetical protein
VVVFGVILQQLSVSAFADLNDYHIWWSTPGAPNKTKNFWAVAAAPKEYLIDLMKWTPDVEDKNIIPLILF